MLSIIIPTRNRADLLALALESLTRQTLSPEAFEVLVIDNGSTDQTEVMAQIFSARLENLRYFYEPEPGLHSGRHRGMLEAKGEILVFTDDDIEALPSWLSSVAEAFSNAEVALVGGNNLPMFLAPPPKWLDRLWRSPALNGGRALPSLSILEFDRNKSGIQPEYGLGVQLLDSKGSLAGRRRVSPRWHAKGVDSFSGRWRNPCFVVRGRIWLEVCVSSGCNRFPQGNARAHDLRVLPPARL